MARKILITSGKGGVGKSSITAHLGYQLSKLGQRVCCMDMDVGLNNLDVIMGVENKVTYDLHDVLEGRCRVKQSLIDISPTLSLIASKHNLDVDFTGKNVRDLTDGLKTRFDFVLIDCPAGIDSGFRRAINACEEVLVVVTPTLTSLRDSDKVLGILANYKVKILGAVINRVRGDLVIRGGLMGCEDVSSTLKIPVVGCIPDDDSIYLSTSLNLYNSRAQKAFKLLAKHLLNGKGKVYDATTYYRGFQGALRRFIRQNV